MIFFSGSCQNTHSDPDLETPDSDGHGHNLTKLGSLTWFPWEYETRSDTVAVVLFKNDKKISIQNVALTELEKNMVFELRKNGTLRFWSKKDYVKSPYETVIQLDGKKSLSKNILNSDELLPEKIDSSGKWFVNFKDSTIKLYFGNGSIVTQTPVK